jgi:Virulence factor
LTDELLFPVRHQLASLLNARASSHNKQPAVLPAMLGTSNSETEMADLIVVYWRDIPAQVIVKKGRQSAKRELPLRFTEAIDMCAMRTGAGDTDAYLAEWRKAEPVPVGDDLETEAEKALAEIDDNYTRERLVALVKAGGKEANV